MNVVVLAPHLDDGPLSLGARIAAAGRRGDRVRIVTVLAGDPSASEPAGPWDAASGFRTAGEAATARREEDRRACAALGAEPAWLPYEDEQYRRSSNDEAIWSAVAASIDGADDVLLPGTPLAHADHRWLAELVLAHRREVPGLILYVEQPYALGRGTPRVAEPAARFVDAPVAWEPARTSLGDRRARRRARRCYGSQLDHLGRYVRGSFRDLERRIAGWERRHGVEPVARVDPAG